MAARTKRLVVKKLQNSRDSKRYPPATTKGPPCTRCGTDRELIGPPKVQAALGPICRACNAEVLGDPPADLCPLDFLEYSV